MSEEFEKMNETTPVNNEAPVETEPVSQSQAGNPSLQGAAPVRDFREGTDTGRSSTYSWVNPKISGRLDDQNNSASYTGSYGGTYHSANTSRSAGQTESPYAGQTESSYQSQSNWQNHPYNQTSQGSYTYQMPTGESTEPSGAVKKSRKKEKKQPSTGKKWMATVAMAVVFGLVGGSVFTATSYVGQKLVGSSQSQVREEIEIPTTTVAPIQQENLPVVNDSPYMSVQQVAENCMPSLVAISTVTVQEVRTFFGTQSQEVPASGTGVIVGKNEKELLIATNDHVVAGAKSLSVVFTDEQTIEGQIKGTDSQNDLAVIAVQLSAIPDETLSQIKIATMGASTELKVGEQVVAIGNALGIGQSVTSGYVSALNRSIESTDENTGETTSSKELIQTDAAINPGNSGGALLNMRGELIGINEAKYSSTAVEGMGFAIPISKAEPILENLMNLETRYKVDESKASYIGITMADVSSSVSEAYGIPQGVCIMSVADDSPAAKAGLKKGDVVTKFDGREVMSSSSLKEILTYYEAGETVTLLVQRADNGDYIENEIQLTLGSVKDMPSSSGQENRGGFFQQP